MGLGDYGSSPSARTLAGQNRLSSASKGKNKFATPVDIKTKSVTYSADTPDLLLDLSLSGSATASKTGAINAVKVSNDGDVSAIALFAYNSYTAEGTVDTDASGIRYVKYLLNPGEEILLPTTRAIVGDAVGEYDGTAVTSLNPADIASGAEIVDTAANVDTATSGDFASDATATTLYVEAAGINTYFFPGDIIKIESEYLEVTDVGTGADLANSTLTVKRGMFGTTAATHADGTAVNISFHNEMHHPTKYSTCQTDDMGRWKSNNFFTKGRVGNDEGFKGIIPGSVAVQFFTQGSQSLGLSDINSNSESGLTASTAYEFDIKVDGGTTFDNLSFTTDSSNTRFGGSNGIVSKIQAALDAQYYTSGNLFEKKVHVRLEGGDMVFRSGSYLSTSAIELGAGSSGTAEFFGTGRIPAAGSISPAIDSRLEPELTYDQITNSSSYKSIFIRDDGYGNLIWANDKVVGKINYETGAHNWTLPEKPNAHFVVSCLHTSAFSGKLDPTTTGKTNSLRQVLANTPQQKCEAKLTVTTY